ncbi:MAG: hypothetical protein ABL999_11125 [Pyrinomonadaceae bacterium]
MKTTLLIALLFVSVISAGGQTKRPVAPKKPTAAPATSPLPPQPAPAPDLSVFGIKLGSPLELPECRGFKTFDEYEIEKPMRLTEIRCFQFGPFKSMDESKPVYRWVVFPFAEKIIIAKDGYVTVTIMDGKVEGLSFKTAGVDSDSVVLSDLKAKYGAPSSIVPAKVQNRMGATFDKVTAVWQFSNLIVGFESVQTSINEGLVIIDTPKGWEFRNAPKSKGTPM